MTEISFQALVWLTYRLGAAFAFGLPLVIYFWGIKKKESSIIRLLEIYWKVASLIAISMLLLNGNSKIGYLTSFISPIIIVVSVWFWKDLNEEIEDLPQGKALIITVKIWRWILSFFGLLYSTLTFSSLSCININIGESCSAWKEAPENFHQATKYIFNFLFGASWSEPISAFIGYVCLIIYCVGILQWIIFRMPKQGRIAGGF
tara:strand:- start:453 stop:1064 length:612 start_codon:yes stop_codon:yes gene_type:complete